MAKRIILADDQQTAQIKDSKGLGMVTDAVTTLFQPKETVSGGTKYVQLGLVFLVGNALATRVHTGKLGISITPTMVYTL